MFWKKKADEPTLKVMVFNFSVSIPVDSSLSDSELSEYVLKQIHASFSKESVCVVKRVTRDGNGIIEKMDVDLKTQ